MSLFDSAVAAQAVDADARPPWRQEGFADLFLPHMARQASEGASLDSTEMLKGALHQADVLLAALGNASPSQQMAAAISNVRRGVQLGQSMLVKMLAVTGNTARFLGLLESLVAEMKSMPAQGLLVLPAGWVTKHGVRHFVMLLVHRDIGGGHVNFAVVNTGDGRAEFHPCRFNPRSVSLQHSTNVFVRKVSIGDVVRPSIVH